MLELSDVSLQLGDEADATLLLAEVTARFPKRHFAAILGPSGCGKSTLLKVIAGLREPSAGHVTWDNRNLEEEDMAPHEIGYVPQFSIAYELLTVWESLESTMQLRVGGISPDERHERIAVILREVGLEGIEDRRVQVLSGGQRRRLAMGLEMASAPHLLLCDEVTSGLDPKAEDEIARLMHDISRHEERIVISVTHSLQHLALYDSVLVLYHGRIAYHGRPDYLFHYFNVEKPEELFPRLTHRKPEEWHRSWLKNRPSYYAESGFDSADPAQRAALSELRTEDPDSNVKLLVQTAETGTAEVPSEPARREPVSLITPAVLTQFTVLLARRWRIFFRDRGQLWLQLALLFGFPFLVVVFAWEGLPQIKGLEAAAGSNFLEQMKNEFAQRSELMRTGSLVSGLIMFQVVLLALMGSNNAAREIAAERLIFEKEKFAGLSPTAYVGAKAAFLGVLVLAQSIWMGVFVNWIIRFPGDLGTQLLLLVLVNAALTAVSLGLSSVMRTAEQASLVSIYLVGFQLPLSGAVLALPSALGVLTRPLIASYWGWSGFIQTMRETRFYTPVLEVTQTPLSATALCLWVLGCHVALGLLLAYAGCKSSRWD